MAGLMDLNDRIFRELDRLESVDMADEAAREAEFDRARAINSMAGRAIENANAAMKAAQMQAAIADDLAVQVAVPRLLLGAGEVSARFEGER